MKVKGLPYRFLSILAILKSLGISYRNRSDDRFPFKIPVKFFLTGKTNRNRAFSESWRPNPGDRDLGDRIPVTEIPETEPRRPRSRRPNLGDRIPESRISVFSSTTLTLCVTPFFGREYFPSGNSPPKNF